MNQHKFGPGVLIHHKEGDGVGWGSGIGEEVREDMKGLINDDAWMEYGGKGKTMYRNYDREVVPVGIWKASGLLIKMNDD